MEGRCEVGESQMLCSAVPCLSEQPECNQKVEIQLLPYPPQARISCSVEQAPALTPVVSNSPGDSCTLLPPLEICFGGFGD